MSTLNLQRILITIGLKTLILVMKTLVAYEPTLWGSHMKSLPQFHSDTNIPLINCSLLFYISVGIHCWVIVLLHCSNTHCNIVWLINYCLSDILRYLSRPRFNSIPYSLSAFFSIDLFHYEDRRNSNNKQIQSAYVDAVKNQVPW